jgi:hypothetical protein
LFFFWRESVKKDWFFFDAAVEPLRFLLHAHDQGCYFPCLFGFL